MQDQEPAPRWRGKAAKEHLEEVKSGLKGLGVDVGLVYEGLMWNPMAGEWRKRYDGLSFRCEACDAVWVIFPKEDDPLPWGFWRCPKECNS